MSKPTTAQNRVLLAAVANGGRVPGNAFAYAGYFAPYRGMEPVIGALHLAAKKTTKTGIETALLAQLDHLQLLAAGGFVGIERSAESGNGQLASDLADAIIAATGRIEGTSVAGIRACIRAGWLTERWEITTEGRDACRHVDPTGYAQALPADEVDGELNRIVRGVPVITRALATAAAETADARGAEGDLVVVADEGNVQPGETDEVRAMLDEIIRSGRDNRILIDPDELGAIPVGFPGKNMTQFLGDTAAALRAGYTVHVFDPKSEDAAAAVAAAMAGYDRDELTPAEQAAADRGISPVAYRRLYPAVDLGDMAPRVLVVRDDLVRRLTEDGREDLARTVAGDPAEAGYRVALTSIRRATGLSEAARKGAFHLELGLTALDGGHDGVAGGCLVKASAALAK